MKPMKAPGHDYIGTKVIILCPEIFAENLSKIFANAILRGVYPDAMKIAKIIALFKSGIKANPNNYRPISFPILIKYMKQFMQKTCCIPGAKTNIVLSSVWMSKIVFYSNGVD